MTYVCIRGVAAVTTERDVPAAGPTANAIATVAFATQVDRITHNYRFINTPFGIVFTGDEPLNESPGLSRLEKITPVLVDVWKWVKRAVLHRRCN